MPRIMMTVVWRESKPKASPEAHTRNHLHMESTRSTAATMILSPRAKQGISSLLDGVAVGGGSLLHQEKEHLSARRPVALRILRDQLLG